jgi:hypothetical protein
MPVSRAVPNRRELCALFHNHASLIAAVVEIFVRRFGARPVKTGFLFLLLSIGTAIATPKEPELPDSVVPEIKYEPQPVATGTLPKLLRDALLAHDEFSQGTDKLPDMLRVARIDLNGDGSPEYIVDSNQPYSGGTAHIIFERQKSGYESIAYFQGGFHLAARVNGYYQICGIGRGGGGNFSYYVLRYRRGEYCVHKVTRANFNEQ